MRKKEWRDVGVGPDEAMAVGEGSKGTGKDAADIIKIVFMDEMTCSLCCNTSIIRLDGSGHFR